MVRRPRGQPSQRPLSGRQMALAAGTLAAVLIAVGMPLHAATPTPPCDGRAALPPPAALGSDAVVQLWHEDDLPKDWRPGDCLDWAPRQGAKLVVTSGRLQAAALDAIIGRVGRISAQRSIRYWSAERQEWRALLEDAFALSAPTSKARREDFSNDELVPGAELYLVYDDAEPVGPVVERLVVRERGPDRLVLASRNITSPRMMGWSVAAAGDLELAMFIDREAGDVWRYYALSRTRLSLPRAMDLADEDYIARATALFRFVAGIDTDASPPSVN